MPPYVGHLGVHSGGVREASDDHSSAIHVRKVQSLTHLDNDGNTRKRRGGDEDVEEREG